MSVTTQAALAIAAADRVTVADCEKLAARLTASTGTPHSLFLSPRGIVVYADTMGAAMGYQKVSR